MSEQLKALLATFLMLCIVLGMCLIAITPSHATEIPRQALQHRADLTRIAHSTWGLNAPIPAFAAQIHQESGWNTDAVSRVGATGAAQFMPATSRWWCALNKLSDSECQPRNVTWSLRALVGYDHWLMERVYGSNEYDRLWATLRSYNGGLGHWQREAALAPVKSRVAIDAQCGRAKRSVIHCAENLGYPDRILNRHQPLYASWGRVVQL
jgi:Transglycosylase SLT domain